MACQKLTDQDAEELMADINGLLRKTEAPKPNLSKEESKTLLELKRDKDRIILDTDPTKKLKAKLVTMLRKIKRETGLDEGSYKLCILLLAPQCFMGYPKSIKLVPPQPIVSSRASATYGVAKFLAKVLKPLVGKSPHHIQSTRDFVNKVREVTLLPGGYLCSYDVTAFCAHRSSSENHQRSIETA